VVGVAVALAGSRTAAIDFMIFGNPSKRHFAHLSFKLSLGPRRITDYDQEPARDD
jgi:hypothetical protein